MKLNPFKLYYPCDTCVTRLMCQEIPCPIEEEYTEKKTLFYRKYTKFSSPIILLAIIVLLVFVLGFDKNWITMYTNPLFLANGALQLYFIYIKVRLDKRYRKEHNIRRERLESSYVPEVTQAPLFSSSCSGVSGSWPRRNTKVK